MKQNSVKHQYYNKVMFIQFTAYKTNQHTSIRLPMSQNKMHFVWHLIYTWQVSVQNSLFGTSISVFGGQISVGFFLLVLTIY